jgi:hypothetical protein
MLSLTRKSEAQQVAAPLWHTNFRNFERLPDTKVVRTTFFINTAAIVLTLGLLLWLGYREYHIYNLGRQIADAQQQIDSNARQNTEALRLTKIFADEEKKLLEVAAFVRTPISPVEFVSLLGKTLPKEISIEYLEARLPDVGAATFLLRGLVAGTPEQASGTASGYVEMLKGHARLGTVFNPITLEKLNRDPNTGSLSFEISLKVKPEAKEKK